MKSPKKVRSKKSFEPKPSLTKRLFANLSYSNPKFARNLVLTSLPIVGFICYLTINSAVNSIRSWQDSSVPKQIKVRASNQDAFRIASDIANQELAKASKQRTSRPTILKNISDRLSNVKLIDRFELRAGLDRTLQVTVTTQVPSYVVTDPNGKSFLVGHLFRIMKEKIDDGSYVNLARIQFNQPLSLKPMVSLNTGIKSATEFQESFKRSFSKYSTRNLVWDPHEGVSAKIVFPADLQIREPLVPITLSTKIIMGFSPYTSKLSQLRNILEDSNHKGIQLETIDFNFSGKAILKISDAKIGTKNVQ
jgi:hypothetical protein